ncbi:hypothetical protein ACONUD_11170 [Microbulbifer harenosus]|uniref:Uracil-DNA glycosylase-like domain-containing protein n=1 Tax=Microbulbifer harenosus TaxID=2576840 RepID=A0ABY2UH00_9GAMM|nr:MULTISPECIES: hypothetical protein [Microbulbifer]QIL91533.1 hypothetical protein GNX18_18420 [Microbulbifer sp. SH-1]TLM76646.1 hypothetical protein FDY93_13050 [Microbulbifer harenosus]
MNELQRTEYLAALGITSYMPRFHLPLAPVAIQAELPPAIEDTPEAAPVAAVMAAVGAEPAPVDETRPSPRPESAPEISRVIGSITTETRTTRAEVNPEPIAPAQQINPFVLSCWWLGDELLAVDSREPGSALPVESLFGNMARALGWHQLTTGRDKLKWPLAENPFAAAAGAADARDTCSSWLEAAVARRPVKSIWLMGQQARDYCAPVILEDAVADWNGVRLIAMPSLSELLSEPLRKREVWQLLQTLYPEQTRR